MQKLISLLILVFLSLSLFAQVGEIQGKVKSVEKNNEGLPFANVYVEVDGIPRGTSTDMDGFYSIKPLPPGMYKITVEYVGYTTAIKDSIVVQADKSTFVDFEMSEDADMLDEVVIVHTGNICFRGLIGSPKIVGKITNKWGKAIQAATIYILGNHPKISRNKSNEAGEFSLTKGNYTIKIKHPDYQSYEGTIDVLGDSEQVFKLKKKRKK